MKGIFKTFTITDILLWSVSVTGITAAFILYDRENYTVLLASLVGVTSLILSAKGNPVGQVLMIVFSLLYGIISFKIHYYGEMITYMGMTLPMAVFSLISWLKHPYGGSHSQVEVSSMNKGEYAVMAFVTVTVTAIFFFILKALSTASLIFSTLSVATSFSAAYLTAKRCRTFALAYALNDTVLIILWSIASAQSRQYISVTICFIMFLVNDIYGFLCWSRMKNAQKLNKLPD